METAAVVSAGADCGVTGYARLVSVHKIVLGMRIRWKKKQGAGVKLFKLQMTARLKI